MSDRNEVIQQVTAMLNKMYELGVKHGEAHINFKLNEANAELVKALRDAVDDMNGWASYASDYFKEKHNLQRDLDEYRAIADKYEVKDV